MGQCEDYDRSLGQIGNLHSRLLSRARDVAEQLVARGAPQVLRTLRGQSISGWQLCDTLMSVWLDGDPTVYQEEVTRWDEFFQANDGGLYFAIAVETQIRTYGRKSIDRSVARRFTGSLSVPSAFASRFALLGMRRGRLSNAWRRPSPQLACLRGARFSRCHPPRVTSTPFSFHVLGSAYGTTTSNRHTSLGMHSVMECSRRRRSAGVGGHAG